jgi:RNA polymerase sigma-70 factor (ECF subfamily)
MEGVNVDQLLESARRGERDPLGELLRSYQNYLTILAASQLDRRLRRRVSPSDLVQETMLAAHRDFPQFRGRSEPEFLAWLRQVFLSCLRHSIDEHVRAKKRDIRCEVSIDQTLERLDRSAECLAVQLADPGPSPSATVRRRERAVELADQLAQLKPDYRDVIVLRNLQGLKFEEIAERLERKPGSVRMLWLRAMEKLRQMASPSSA